MIPSDDDRTLTEIIEQQRAVALDQAEAAWQLYISRIEEVLSTGWREHLATALNSRFAEIGEALQQAFASQLERRLEKAREDLRAQLAGALNQWLRRVRAAESDQEVYEQLIELAGLFSERAVLVVAGDGSKVRIAAWRDFAAGAAAEAPDLEFSADSAPALRNVIESKETTVAENSSAELSGHLAAFFEGFAYGKIVLSPVVARDRTMAVLCAAHPSPETAVPGVELLCTVAGLTLEARAAASQRAMARAPSIAAAPEWTELSPADAEFHAAARRFARVRVAEMRLFRSQAVREGRERKDLYAALKSEIDSAREAFRSSYLNACPTMIDYLHLELVRTLANDDALLLGPDYPGPLV
jgi:hypothetical protein